MTPHEAKALAIVAVGNMDAKSAAKEADSESARRTFITDEEIEALVLGFFRSREETGGTDEEVRELLNEVIATRYMASCIELAAKGLINVDIDPQQPPGERLVFRPRKDLEPVLKEALQRRVNGG
jgi:hypothetical protein